MGAFDYPPEIAVRGVLLHDHPIPSLNQALFFFFFAHVAVVLPWYSSEHSTEHEWGATPLDSSDKCLWFHPGPHTHRWGLLPHSLAE